MDDGTVVRIAGQTVGNELHLLARVVLKRIRTRVGFDKAIDGIIIVKINIDLAEETQYPGRFGKIKDGDGM